MRTLIVEDDTTSLRMLQAYVEPHGTTEFARDGEEAWDAWTSAFERGEPFDLVCLDINMPKVDGVEFLTGMRQFEEEHGVVGSTGVKVVVTTGACDYRSYYEAASAGCTAYICKPINRDKFMQELARLNLVQNTLDK